MRNINNIQQPLSIQVPNYGEAFSQGIQAGNQLRTTRLAEQRNQMLAQEQKMKFQAEAARNELINLASAGDPQALSQLAGVDPQAAKGVQDNIQRKILRSAQLANTVIGKDVDQAKKPTLYRQALRQAEVEGLDISQLPAEYSEEAEVYLQGIRSQGRDLEKAIQQDLESPMRTAKLESEILGQRKTEADIARTNVDTRKTRQEILSRREERRIENLERETANKEGLSLEAYRAKQLALGKAQGAFEASQKGLIANKPLSGEAAKVTTIANDGLNSVQNVRNLLYTKGKLSPRANKIMSGATFLPNILQAEDQQQFEATRQNLADLIGRLRSGGAINSDEEKRFLNLVPKFGDKQGTIEFKLKQLEGNFSKLQEGITGRKSKSADSASGSVNGISWRLK